MITKLWSTVAICIWLAVLATALNVGCNDAEMASHNISEASDNFEIDRRVVFLNGITNEYILEVAGRCSIHDQGHQLELTCKLGEDDYRKHFLGLSDNVTYFVEQLSAGDVSVYHYRLTFKPQAVVPDFDFRADPGALIENESESMQ